MTSAGLAPGLFGAEYAFARVYVEILDMRDDAPVDCGTYVNAIVPGLLPAAQVGVIPQVGVADVFITYYAADKTPKGIKFSRKRLSTYITSSN